jgi:calcineurin-like phosphoesterase family protein
MFFTADLHFNHKNISRFCNRPFSSVHEMNKKLTSNWNKTVNKNDSVYILGDLVIKPKEAPKFLQKLNGKKFYILGNHDCRAEKYIRRWEEENDSKLVEEVSHFAFFKMNKNLFSLCHYAMRVWNKSHWNSSSCSAKSYQLHGHSHGELPPLPFQLDVGVDNAFKLLGEYRPFSLDEILSKIEEEQGV